MKVINLSYSQHLIKLPDFRSVPNLEILILEGSIIYFKVHINISVLTNTSPLSFFYYYYYYFDRVHKPGYLPRGFYKLQCLQMLSCRGCSKVKRFSEIKGNMRELRALNLSGTAIMEVPPSIKHLNGLEDLDLGNCHNLVSLPMSICSLRSLKTPKLNKCSKLKSFPEIQDGDMENLRELDLNSTAIEELSSSIGHLKALEFFNFSILQKPCQPSRESF